MSETWTRRRVLLGTGSLAAATVTSIVAVSDNASATVTGEFTVPNADRTLVDTTLSDVRLAVNADYSVKANAPIDAVELELHVGATAGSLHILDRVEREVGEVSHSGEAALSGSIIATPPYDIENFQPSSGSLTTGVIAALRLYALRDGEVVAEAEQTEAFEVTVTQEELQITTGVGGEGRVGFETATPEG